MDSDISMGAVTASIVSQKYGTGMEDYALK